MTVLPDFGAATFTNSTDVNNPYFPLPGGTINSYNATLIDPETGEVETERNDHFATFETKSIEGVETVVVRDTAYEDGVLVEDTLDWYAQDDAGNTWYLGEIAINHNYDDDGNFIGTDFDGSWEAGVDGAVPGWIMETDPMAGDSYFQEFYEGVAEDEGEVTETGRNIDIDFGSFGDVIKILDTSALEPDVGAFKNFAPGIGMVLEEEVLLADPENPELLVELNNIRTVDNSSAIDPTDLSVEGDGSEKTVTFLNEDANANGAIGGYTFNLASGEIGEGRILFANTEDVQAGATASMTVGTGEALGLFLVPDVEDLGLELEDFTDGGLFFRNMLSGDVADVYDGDPSTTYTPGVATIHDGLAPLVTDADGNILPMRAYNSVGDRDGFNFLNPVAGENAQASDIADGIAGVEVFSFEDGLASTEDYDRDFDDAFVAVSAAPLSDEDLEALLDSIGISRIVGSDQGDKIRGTDDDDQIIGLEGNDHLFGKDGDDVIEASDGNDFVRGGEGDDEITGEDGNDRLFGGKGDDEIDGGDGNDRVFGRAGDDELEGGDGDDVLSGGGGSDILIGGSGDDVLRGSGGDDRLIGGADDDLLIGEADSSDVFVFNLENIGNDTIRRFEVGTDLIEMTGTTGAERFEDLDIGQMGRHAVISLNEGEITLQGTDAAQLSSDDFLFV